MRRLRGAAVHLCAFLAYAAGAVLYTWPLARHFKTHFPGTMGESISNVWNIWHFGRTLALHGNPLWTDFQYAPYGTNMLLAQYTLVHDVLGLWLVPLMGMAPFYNGMYMLGLALAGYLTFAFARDFKAPALAAFAAGCLFAFSPYSARQIMNGRGTDYMNFYPAALFLWGLCRAIRSGSVRDCVMAAAGLTLQWLYSYHYFLGCMLVFPVLFCALERPLAVDLARRQGWTAGPAAAAVLWTLAGAAALLALSGEQKEFHGAGSLAQLLRYVAPYGAFWACLGLWAAGRWSLKVRPAFGAPRWSALAPYAGTLACWLAMNYPMVGAIVLGMLSGEGGSPSNWWRGGGNPFDLSLAAFGNVYHPLWAAFRGTALGATRLFGDRETFSFSLAATAAGAWLWRRAAGPWEKAWVWGILVFAVLTLGPWLKLLGVHTYLPMPFFFLHMLPFYVQMATGEHFQFLVSLFGALALAAALSRLRARWAALAVLAMAALDFAHAGVPLWRLETPPVVERLAARPYGLLLTVPVYTNFHIIINPGSIGDDPIGILAAQMVHGKPVVGGFLGRVPRRMYAWTMGDPVFTAILAAQRGQARPAPILTDRRRIGRYLRNMKIRYLLVKKDLPAPLSRALRTWPVKRVDFDAGFDLYEVAPGIEKRSW